MKGRVRDGFIQQSVMVIIALVLLLVSIGIFLPLGGRIGQVLGQQGPQFQAVGTLQKRIDNGCSITYGNPNKTVSVDLSGVVEVQIRDGELWTTDGDRSRSFAFQNCQSVTICTQDGSGCTEGGTLPGEQMTVSIGYTGELHKHAQVSRAGSGS